MVPLGFVNLGKILIPITDKIFFKFYPEVFFKLIISTYKFLSLVATLLEIIQDRILIFLFPKSEQNTKLNDCEGAYFFKKAFLRESMPPHPEPSKKELHRSHFEELAF